MIGALLALATIAASPATLPAALAAARGGDTVLLKPGTYPRLVLRDRTFSPPLLIRASGARLTATLASMDGVEIRGGTLTGATGGGVSGYAAHIDRSRRVTMRSVAVSASTRGIVVATSRDVLLTKVALSGLRSDGINVSSSQRVRIDGATCRNFAPAPGDHPDCVQAWSRPGGITADLTITRVDAEGKMQGIFLGNHVRDGVDDGGYDRVTITGNRVANTYTNAVAVFDCRGCTIGDNRIETLPGSPNTAMTRVMRCVACTIVGDRR